MLQWPLLYVLLSFFAAYVSLLFYSSFAELVGHAMVLHPPQCYFHLLLYIFYLLLYIFVRMIVFAVVLLLLHCCYCTLLIFGTHRQEVRLV